MARNKEALVLLVDVGPSMHNLLPEVEKVCSRLIQKKLIFAKSDQVGVVLFGTEGTDNELQKEVGGYEHVVVSQQIKVVDGDIVQGLENLPRGTANGDFLDAIVVGMDMLIKKFGSTNKGKQRLCLITNALCPVKEPFEGPEDQVNAISLQMKAHRMKLECVIIRGKLTGAADQMIVDENDRVLQTFSKRAITRIEYIDNPTSILGAVRTRNISPVTVFRGDLELNSTMKIKVWVYKKTSEEKLPTLKKFSEEAPPSDKYATHEIKMDFEYKFVEDANKVVPPEQRIKGYSYGPQVVPISSDEWQAVKFKPEKGVKLLGFTNASNIVRHQFMKDVYVFIPEPENKKAIIALSSVARAMKEMDKVAILRCVWRQGQGNVVIGVLTPNISYVNNVPDSFYFNVLPFAEDIREFQFPSFSRLPSPYQPSEKQQEAADNLVKMLDLAPSGCESLKPDFTPNPVLERYYHFLELKSRKKDTEVPPLDRSLKRIVEPDQELLSQSYSVIETYQSLFQLQDNPKKKKSSRRVQGVMVPITNTKMGHTSNGATSLENFDSSARMVQKIGDLDPIKDFEAMLEQRDGTEWIARAIGEMKNYISDILENSYEGDTYPKATECLLALRRGCVLEQEPKEFNQFLINLYSRWKTTDLLNFFEKIASKGITLISKNEAVDSEVTEEQANNFPAKAEFASQ